jgi:hypothetical protein
MVTLSLIMKLYFAMLSVESGGVILVPFGLLGSLK